MITYQDVLDAEGWLDVTTAKLDELSEDYRPAGCADYVLPGMHEEWDDASRDHDASIHALTLMADSYLTQCAQTAYESLYEVRDRLAGKPLWYRRTADVAKGAVPSFEGVVVSFGSKDGLTLSFESRSLSFVAGKCVTREVETSYDPTGSQSGYDRKWFAQAAKWPKPSAPDADRSAADVLDEAADFERRLESVYALRAEYERAVRDLTAPYASDRLGYCAKTIEREAFDLFSL